MQIRVFYDSGDGRGALMTAALEKGLLPIERMPHEAEIVQVFEEHYRGFRYGRVYRLHASETSVFWCGLGRAAPFTIRAWRHFLELYDMRQTDFIFIDCPLLVSRKRSIRLFRKTAKEVIKNMAIFQSVILQRWKED